MKVCKICKRELEQSDFHVTKTSKSGKVYYRGDCKDCHNEKKYKYKRGLAMKIKNYKQGLACYNCGYSKETHPDFSPKALEFHHHRKDKTFSVANAVGQGFGFETIKKEMDKCLILCCRCHKEHHYKEPKSKK